MRRVFLLDFLGSARSVAGSAWASSMSTGEILDLPFQARAAE